MVLQEPPPPAPCPRGPPGKGAGLCYEYKSRCTMFTCMSLSVVVSVLPGCAAGYGTHRSEQAESTGDPFNVPPEEDLNIVAPICPDDNLELCQCKPCPRWASLVKASGRVQSSPHHASNTQA